jgi:CheY-like chemotaxis protein
MILIVDDDEDVRDSIADFLTLKGYMVAVAENGQVGLSRLIAGDAPCVVLLDLVMPVMDGWQFLTSVQGDPVLSQIPVVVVSAHAATHAPTGSAGLIRKPFAFADLYEAVEQHCGPPPLLA